MLRLAAGTEEDNSTDVVTLTTEFIDEVGVHFILHEGGQGLAKDPDVVGDRFTFNVLQV